MPADPQQLAHALLRGAFGHLSAGRLDAAEAQCQQARQHQPASAYAARMLGQIALRRGDLASAADWVRQAQRLEPRNPAHGSDLGRILGRLTQWEEAVAAFETAIARGDRSAQTLNDLGVALHQAGRISDAVEIYDLAIAAAPNDPHSRRNRAGALAQLGRAEESVAALKAMCALAPTMAAAHDDLLLTLHYPADYDPNRVLDETRKWAGRFAAPLYPARAQFSNDLGTGRRLRVGYVSPDVRLHPVGFMLQAILNAHDRGAFQTFCYSATRRTDALTVSIQNACDVWRDISRMNDEQESDLVRGDGIDLLIDLAGHSADNRLALFARKPAPVQATWFGYPATTGLATMDYRITDARAEPPGKADALSTEKLARLAPVAWCYPPPEAPEPGPPPAAAAGFVTFACLNRLQKITPRMLNLWARILGRLPASRLLLLGGDAAGDPRLATRLRQPFISQGVAEERVEIVARLPHAAYLQLYQTVDVALDCFPYQGALTTCDALWMGVPVIALAGDAYVSRQSVSILGCMGLDDCIALTEQDYVGAAIGLAGDADRRALLRATLRDRLRASPLCDIAAFTRELEQCYRQMWARWRGGQQAGAAGV